MGERRVGVEKAGVGGGDGGDCTALAPGPGLSLPLAGLWAPPPLLLAPSPSCLHVLPLRPLLRHHPRRPWVSSLHVALGPTPSSCRVVLMLLTSWRLCACCPWPLLWKVTPREQHPCFPLEEGPPACSEQVTGPVGAHAPWLPHILQPTPVSAPCPGLHLSQPLPDAPSQSL